MRKLFISIFIFSILTVQFFNIANINTKDLAVHCQSINTKDLAVHC